MPLLMPPDDLASHLYIHELHIHVSRQLRAVYFEELHSLLDRTRCPGRLEGYVITSPLLFLILQLAQ